jgi:hypothetical protein
MRDIQGSQIFSGWDKSNWGTGFTPFRWIIPELCSFKGRAIYLDVDMLVLDDIRELWETPIPKDKVLVSLPGNYSVIVFDCERFKSRIDVKGIAEWKKRSCNPSFKGLYNEYVTQLETQNLVEPLIQGWNSLDHCDHTTKLIHYTNKKTQPWCPYPERHKYTRHADKACEALWFKMYDKAMEMVNDETFVRR